MSENKPDREALETAQGLTQALQGVRGELKDINTRQDAAEKRQVRAERLSHRGWLVLVGVIVSLLIDGTVTGLYVANSLKLNHTAAALSRTTAELQHTRASVSELHNVLIVGCQANNELKSKQATVWTFIEQFLGPQPGQTAAQKAGAEKFLTHLERHVQAAYAPRDCHSAYGVPPSGRR